ncbi:hypothetical protein ACOSQ4_000362 [Xanthoceras sorbifolium]
MLIIHHICNGPGRSTALARPRYSQVLSALGALRRRPSRLSFASLIRIRTWYLSISTKPYQVEYQLVLNLIRLGTYGQVPGSNPDEGGERKP